MELHKLLQSQVDLLVVVGRGRRRSIARWQSANDAMLLGFLMSDKHLFQDAPEFPVLCTERLVLRELRENDAAAAFRMFSDPEVMRYTGKSVHADVAETLASLLRDRDAFPARAGIYWAITLRGDDAFIGSCCFFRLMSEHRRAEIGYDLHSAYWGRGLMAEALHAILAFGFTTMGLHSAEAQIDPDNERSRRVLSRLGFRQDGLLRENFYYAGRYLDTAVFTLLSREHQPPVALRST